MSKKYTMIVTAENERYENGDVGLDFFMNNPWEGDLEAVIFGDTHEELWGDGEKEGLFYQLYDNNTGIQIGYGTIDPNYPAEEIQEWEEFVKWCSSTGNDITRNQYKEYRDCNWNEITIKMERRQSVSKQFRVSTKQLEALSNGENLFFEELHREFRSSGWEFDYTVTDRNGNIIIG